MLTPCMVGRLVHYLHCILIACEVLLRSHYLISHKGLLLQLFVMCFVSRKHNHSMWVFTCRCCFEQASTEWIMYLLHYEAGSFICCNGPPFSRDASSMCDFATLTFDTLEVRANGVSYLVSMKSSKLDYA